MLTDTLVRLAAFSLAIAPVFIILSYFIVVTRTRFDDDTVWAAFGLGACVAFPCVLLAKIVNSFINLGNDVYSSSFQSAVFEAAVPEELAKLLAVACLCNGMWKTLSSRQLFIISIACSCGFAGLENIFYVVQNKEWGLIAAHRSISSVPGHAFVGAVMGYMIYRALHSKYGSVWWVASIGLPILLHGAYDFFLFAAISFDAQYISTYSDLTKTMIIGFVMTVIAEGLCAHILLRHIDNSEDSSRKINSQYKALKYIHAVFNNYLSWLFIGVICLFFSYMFWHASSLHEKYAEKFLDQGFAVFTILHAIAFLSLSYFQKQRQKLDKLR